MTKSGTTATFAYNADGLRIRKTVNGTVTDYTLHGKQVVHVKQGSNNLHFFYDAQGRPAVVDFNGTKYGYVHNLQGDIVALIDGSGTQMVEYTYDAWGKPLTKTGTLAATLGTLNPFRYRGYVFDEETGLYYLRSRYYNPVWGRFLNADSNYGKIGKLLSSNMFCYCYNSPIVAVDSDGRSPVQVQLDKASEDALLRAYIDYKDSRGKNLTIELPGVNVRGLVYEPDWDSITAEYTVKDVYYPSIVPEIQAFLFAVSENSSNIGDTAYMLSRGAINSDYVAGVVQVVTEIISRSIPDDVSHSYKEHDLLIRYICAFKKMKYSFFFTSCDKKGCKSHLKWVEHFGTDR